MLMPSIPVSWYAIAALALSLAGCGWALRVQIRANGEQIAQIRSLNGAILRASEQRAVDRATLDRLAKKNAATARESALARASLQRSLTANPTWAAQPVPKEVQDALRQP